MPAERLPMRKVREVLRLKYACGASERVIARSVGIGRTAIGEYIRRAAVIGITWPIPEAVVPRKRSDANSSACGRRGWRSGAEHGGKAKRGRERCYGSSRQSKHCTAPDK